MDNNISGIGQDGEYEYPDEGDHVFSPETFSWTNTNEPILVDVPVYYASHNLYFPLASQTSLTKSLSNYIVADVKIYTLPNRRGMAQ